MTPDLETRLRDLATVIDFPPTPDLATPVERRLGAGPARRPRWGWRPVLIAAAILLLVAAVATAAAVRWWSIPGTVAIQRVAVLPEIPPGVGFQLGEPVASAAAAAQEVGFAVPSPTDARLGPPDAVYVGDLDGRSMATLVWRPRDGLPALARPDIGATLTVLEGGAPRGEVVGKMLTAETEIEDVELGDGPAYFISGAPHFVVFDIGGEIRGQDMRLAANVLLWQQGDVVLRLEANVPRDVALEMARSVQ